MNSTYLDSRELDKRIDELTDERSAFLKDKINGRNKALRLEAWEGTSEHDDLVALTDLRAEMHEPSWKNGITFIPEDAFEDYAREFAVEIGAVEDDTRWPANHIDWKAAADDLKSDFSRVGCQGVSYLYRS